MAENSPAQNRATSAEKTRASTVNGIENNPGDWILDNDRFGRQLTDDSARMAAFRL